MKNEFDPPDPPVEKFQRDDQFKATVDERKIPYQGRRDPRGHEASTITDCVRALWYRRYKYPQERAGPNFQTNRGMIGKAVEYGIGRWFAYAFGLRGEQAYHFNDEWGIGGSVDYVLPIDGDELPVEIKSVDATTYSGERAFGTPKVDAYYQLQTYLWLMEKSHGWLVYYDIFKIENWWAFRVQLDNAAVAWIQARIKLLDTIYAKGAPPERPTKTPKAYYKCGFCPYARPCWEGTEWGWA